MIFVSFNHNQNMAEKKSSKTQFYRLVAPIEQLLTRFEKKITLSKKRNEKKKQWESQP